MVQCLLLTRLNGHFAFAIWDPTRRRVVVARDRFGVKPVYYYDGGSFLAFASEIKGLLALPGVPRKLCLPALNEYFTFQNIFTDRTFLEGYIKPGIGPRNWVSRTNYPALNVVQTGPEEMSLYVDQDYAQPTAHLRRYSLRLDGFASIRAGATEAELLTKPFVFAGSELHINFATSAAGGLRFELQSLDGQPLPSFTLADCQEQIGNEIDRVVTWKNSPTLSELNGQPVRLRCVLKDADLFAIQFANQRAE